MAGSSSKSENAKSGQVTGTGIAPENGGDDESASATAQAQAKLQEQSGGVVNKSEGKPTNTVSGPSVNTEAMQTALENSNENNKVTIEERHDLPEGMVVQGVRRADGSFVGQQVMRDQVQG